MGPGAPSFQPHAPAHALPPPASKPGNKLAKGCLIVVGAFVAVCAVSIGALFAVNLAKRSSYVAKVQELATALATATPTTACHALQGGEAPTGCALNLAGIRSSTPALVGAQIEPDGLFIDFDAGREIVDIVAKSGGSSTRMRVTFTSDGLIAAVSGAGLGASP